MKEEVILIFDVGKTNKKVLLFDRKLQILHEEETRFEEVVDEDGFPCDDVVLLESWIGNTVLNYSQSKSYDLKGVNFTTYGASLVHLDNEGKRLTPVYNYLKPLSAQWLDEFYAEHRGVDEFSRKTASPALGMLNSGLQILWLKREKPALYGKVDHILHLPNYFSYLVTGKMHSEHTSIGCHTAMWDFDRMGYHQWLQKEGVKLPDPIPVSHTNTIKWGGSKFETGVGIHDSSSSLAPYILGAVEPFALISTGTWCISMNPYNTDPLTDTELKNDCLSFLGVHGKAVKSSRFFLGHIHDVNLERMEAHFGVKSGSYRQISPSSGELKSLWDNGKEHTYFFKNGVPATYADLRADLFAFHSFEEAYACFICDLSKLAAASVRLVVPDSSPVGKLYISGGFSKNPFFTGFMSLAFSRLRVFTSEVANASSLGAALIISESVWPGAQTSHNLGLTKVEVAD